MKKNILTSILAALIYLSFFSPTLVASPGDTLWAKSGGGSGDSEFISVTRDSIGNFYTAGYIENDGIYDFGNGIIVNGTYSSGENSVIAKYDSNGIVQWAKSTVIAPNKSKFNSIARDNTGNIYAAGLIEGDGSYDFGNGVTVSGSYSSGENIVLVKYDSNGNAQWAKSTVSGVNESRFLAVAVDTAGNIYAAGSMYTDNAFDFGNSVTVSGAYDNNNNFILVKYNSNGDAQWAKSMQELSFVQPYPISSEFRALAIGNYGDVYAAGVIGGIAVSYFGDGVYASGGCYDPTPTFNNNAALVKYNSDGCALWAKSTVSNIQSSFDSVAVDSAENIYAAGGAIAENIVTFGNGVSATGQSSNPSAFLVKYGNDGSPEWAQNANTAPNTSVFKSVVVDSDNNPSVFGHIYQTGSYEFGNNVTVSGSSSTANALVLNYNATGAAQFAKSVTSGSADSKFLSATIDSDNNLGAAGQISQTGNYNFGNNVTVNGTNTGPNIVLVKYLGTTAESSSSSSLSSNSTSSSNNTISSSSSSSSTKIKSSSSSSNGGNVASDASSMKPKLLILGSVIFMLIP